MALVTGMPTHVKAACTWAPAAVPRPTARLPSLRGGSEAVGRESFLLNQAFVCHLQIFNKIIVAKIECVL